MRKLFFIFLLFFKIQFASAETIELTDHSFIEAKIIKKTDHDITVNIYGVEMTYLLEEILSIDASPVEGRADVDIPRLLKAREYPEYTWGDIKRELEMFLGKIDFYDLKNKVRQAQRNPEELKRLVAVLGRLIKQQGCLNLQNPHPLIRLLVNSLGHEDILSIIESSSFSQRKKEEEKREIFACSAITQLASIILDLLGIDGRIMIAPGHVFNCIPLDSRHVLFADFSNEVFETVDLEVFYRTDGKYQVLKEQQRLSRKRVLDINKKWEKGFMPLKQRDLLNLKLYFYIFMTPNNSASAILYTNRGNDYEFIGDYNQALVNYTKALKINPNIEGVYCNRGLVYAAMGNLPQAIADYDKAIEINPNDEDAYNNRGLAYKNKEDFIHAISDFNKALEINPNSAQIYDNRGNAYSVRGQFNQGIFNYSKAIEIAPNDATSYQNRATCYYYLREYDKAWEDVHKAEELGAVLNAEFIHLLKKATGSLFDSHFN